ncbi:hypothetical protein TNCV_4343631 [Trichonephila clavipes]|nr:hypothetical protein TNCV_4343631 [Trichonephila clavipes]
MYSAFVACGGTLNSSRATSHLMGLVEGEERWQRGELFGKYEIIVLLAVERFKSRSLVAEPSSLPADYIKGSAVFEVIGVDLAGPLYLKRGEFCEVGFLPESVARVAAIVGDHGATRLGINLKRLWVDSWGTADQASSTRCQSRYGVTDGGVI